MMSLFLNVIELICVVLTFTIALFIFQLERKNPVNQLGAILTFSIFIWTFGLFMAGQSESFQKAAFWIHFANGSVAACGLTLHFSLLFTQNTRFLRNPLVHIFLYVPAIIIIVAKLAGGDQGATASEYFAYSTYQYKWAYWLFQIWGFGCLIAAVVVFFLYYLKAKAERERRKLKFLVLATAIGALPSIPIVIIFESSGALTVVVSIVFAIVAYAMWRYQIFSVGPESAARQIVSTMSDCLFLLDADWKITFANRAALDLLQYSEKGIHSLSFIAVLKDGSRNIKILRKSLESGEQIQAQETRFIKGDGSLVHVLLSVSELKDNSGLVSGYVVTAVDVTEQKKAREKLDELQVQLREISRQAGMSEVATSILHNIGNALNSVNVSSNIALDKARRISTRGLVKIAERLQTKDSEHGSGYKTPENIEQLVNYIVKLSEVLPRDKEAVVEELHELIQSVDRVIQIVQMQQEYTGVRGIVERIKIRDILEDVLELSSSELREQCILVEKKLDFDGSITTEKQKLVQILINLISNAIKATQHQEKERQLLIRTDIQDDRKITIHITDNGEGIEEENLEKIFSFGFSTRKSGQGFGLHISALSAQELGGRLSVESPGKNHGSTFILELPVKSLQDQDVAKIPSLLS